ncbi:glycosyl hydrolase family 18 protein [Streptomyces sp. NPDC057428]|uniref:glycosyl hydrolase family 18 protein n=1 Tax=Streptomyces sp. NPDC057428 TaxID=3346129 RepID=UPI00367DEF70
MGPTGLALLRSPSPPHRVHANVQGGKCTIGDSYADHEKAYTADQPVDGVADTWDQELRGNFNQLRKLKKLHPGLKVIWSFGGWSWSGGFSEAAQDPATFAESCHSLVEDPRWADVFDGIDIDWEYPNACGLTCDTSGRDAYGDLLSALRSKFGTDSLITSAITADGSVGGKIDAVDYAGAAEYEAGIGDYKVLKNSCPATGTVAGTAYAHCGTNWWSYDTPATIGTKMAHKADQGLGGTFFRELSGDTADGELIKAIN